MMLSKGSRFINGCPCCLFVLCLVYKIVALEL